MEKDKEFIVSTADFAFYYKEMLACTGTVNLNTSINVSEQSKEINAGKGNMLIFVYKYGRQIAVDLETAEWNLAYLAIATGGEIAEELSEFLALRECVNIKNGIGTLQKTAIGNVDVELPSGVMVQVKGDGREIDLTKFGLEDTELTVRATYMYNANGKVLTIDGVSSPLTGRLVLDADKHTQGEGKVGSVQIIIPSYSVDGNFDISFTPDGVSSTKIAGKSLAVESDTCNDGKPVMAYIKEFTEKSSVMPVVEIVANAPQYQLSVADTATISVFGSKGPLYKNVAIDNNDCTFTSDKTSIATVAADGTVTAVASGTAKITVDYKGIKDEIEFTVV